MDDMPYQTISIEQSDLARKYLVANAEQELTEQEKNQVFSNIGMKSWIDKTYPDLGGGGGGSNLEGIVGENGSIQYSDGERCLLYSGRHVYRAVSIDGQLRMSGIKADNGEISFGDGLPVLHFGNDVFPSGFSSPESYSDTWMPNVGMIKRMLSTYGGSGGSGGGGDASNSIVGPNGSIVYGSSYYGEQGVLYDGSHYFSNTRWHGNICMGKSSETQSIIHFMDYAPTICFGSSWDVYPSRYSQAETYSDAWIPNVAMVKRIVSSYGGGSSGGSGGVSLSSLTNNKMTYSVDGDYVYCAGQVTFFSGMDVSGQSLFRSNVTFSSDVEAPSGIYFSDSHAYHLYVSNGILYFDGRKVLTA